MAAHYANMDNQQAVTITGKVDIEAFANAHIETFLMSGSLAIDPVYAMSQFAVYMRDLQLLALGMPYAQLGISERRAKSAPALLSFAESGADTLNMIPARYSDEAPKGSIAKLNIRGVMMLEGGASSYGIADQIEWLNRAYESPNIQAVLIEFESGGGEARAGDLLATTISERNKPVIAYVNRTAGSAAYNAAAATDEIILSSMSASVGSIGVFLSVDKKMIEKYKETMLDIYSDATPGKNRDFRAALDGDFSGLKSRVTTLTDQFHQFVKDNRNLTGDRQDVKETLEGDMFSGTDATRRGLADLIGNMTMVSKRMKFHVKNKK